MPGADKQLAIVIPVHNRAGIVGRTLASIASQKHIEKTRIILVDNNSTDSTADELRRWARAHGQLDVALLSEPKPGACAARNRGLAESDCEWTMFFDSDDEMLPGLIETLLTSVAASPSAELIGWDVSLQLPDGSRRTATFSLRQPLRNHLIHSLLSTQRYAARTALFRRAGGWDEGLSCWNDYELGVRLLLLRPEMRKLKTSGLMVRLNFTPDSITGQRLTDRAEERFRSLKACRRHLADSAAVGWIDFRRAIFAAQCRREGRRDIALNEMRKLLADNGPWRRLLFRAIYAKHRLYPRGSHYLAMPFLK